MGTEVRVHIGWKPKSWPEQVPTYALSRGFSTWTGESQFAMERRVMARGGYDLADQVSIFEETEAAYWHVARETND